MLINKYTLCFKCNSTLLLDSIEVFCRLLWIDRCFPTPQPSDVVIPYPSDVVTWSNDLHPTFSLGTVHFRTCSYTSKDTKDFALGICP